MVRRQERGIVLELERAAGLAFANRRHCVVTDRELPCLRHCKKHDSNDRLGTKALDIIAVDLHGVVDSSSTISR